MRKMSKGLSLYHCMIFFIPFSVSPTLINDLSSKSEEQLIILFILFNLSCVPEAIASTILKLKSID